MERFLQQGRNLLYELQARVAHIKTSVKHEIFYVCQFAKSSSAEPSLKKELQTVNDSAWKETGASSPERYADWAFTMCGMASTAMDLNHFQNVGAKPAELAEDALRHGVYIEDEKEISSMRYKEFASWAKKHVLQADVYSRLSTRGIEYALSIDKLVMVSVNPNIRGYDTAPLDQKGGHLVLVTGYDLEKGTISINNPSGFESTNTQISHTLSVRQFRTYFAGLGLVLSKAEI